MSVLNTPVDIMEFMNTLSTTEMEFDPSGLITPSDMFFPNEILPYNFELNLEEGTPLLSPTNMTTSDLAPYIKVPMLDLAPYDMSFTHSPLGSPFNEYTQNMLMFHSAHASPTYNNWFPDYCEGRRASTPCFTEYLSASNVMQPQFNSLQVPQEGFNKTYPQPYSKPQEMGRRASCSGGVRRRSVSKPESPKSFHCTEEGCNKVFKRSEHLKRHLKSIHSGAKPFACPFPGCTKNFSRADNLGQHMRIHRDPSEKLRSKGVTSSTPFVLPIASTMEEELAYPTLS